MAAKKKPIGKNDFLDKFLRGDKPQRPSDLEKNAVVHDKFDREDYNHLQKEMREFAVSEDRLTDKVTTGASAFADAFFALVKAVPELEKEKKMRPSHRVNHAVAKEMQELKEYEELRSYSTGDEIAAALATISMEPELETLFDRLEQEQKMAEDLQQQYDQMEGLQQEERDLDDMLNDLENPPTEQEAQDHQDQKGQIQKAMEMLQDGIDQSEAELDQALGGARGEIKQGLKGALKSAINEASDMDQTAQTWGLDPGYLHRLPPEKRIEMARRLNNERFKRIAQLFGPMHRMAFAEQQRKTIHSNDEIYDIETGNDLGRLLAAELINIRHPLLKWDFYRRFFEGDLLQYKLHGTEKLAKGAIVCCIDGSGSMSGEPEIWSKAVALCLLQIAKVQKREFYAIEFGGPRTMLEFDFRDPKNITPDNIISFAESFLNGGTDFMTPLSRSLDLMREEHERRGAVKADIVFITDGECGVDPTWMENFKAEQERLAFRVYGVAIGCSPESEPLATICDHRVLTVKQMTSGDDLRDIFRTV